MLTMLEVPDPSTTNRGNLNIQNWTPKTKLTSKRVEEREGLVKCNKHEHLCNYLK